MRRWLIVGLGLIMLVLLGAVAYSQLALSAASRQAASSGGITARQAFASAAALAAEWQADARLAAASGQLSASSRENIEWAFQFFSPATQRLALIMVADGAARLVHESLSPYPVPTFSADAWRVDSDQAWQVWWDQGGGSMMGRRSDVDMLMQLRMADRESRHPTWTVAGIVSGTDAAFVVMVDAFDGTLVEP